MKKGKASGTSGGVSKMLLASGDVGIERMASLFNKIILENKAPEDWDTSVIVNCFKAVMHSITTSYFMKFNFFKWSNFQKYDF